MSRNRIRKWNETSFTIPAEASQVPAHPSSKKMWNVDVTGKNRPKDSEWAEFRKKHEKGYLKKFGSVCLGDSVLLSKDFQRIIHFLAMWFQFTNKLEMRFHHY